MNTARPKISFCLPVYNVQDYIEACIESLYAQELSDFEIICIDDCSTDDSGIVLDRIAEVHSEVCVYHSPVNRGVGHSRNLALQYASGKYIWFVDPDDMLMPGIAKQFIDIAEEKNAQTVIGNLYWFMGFNVPKSLQKGPGTITEIGFSDPKKFYISHDQSGKISFSVCHGIFLKSFLDDNQIRFEEDLFVLEDYTFWFITGLTLNKAYHVDMIGYLVRVRPGSATRRDAFTDYTKRYECARKVLGIYRSYQSKPENDKYSEAVKAHLLHMQETAAIFLAAVIDSRYVRKELKWLQKAGFYPYKHREDYEFSTHKPNVEKTIKYILPHKVTFWMFHYAYVIRYWFARIRRRANRNSR